MESAYPQPSDAPDILYKYRCFDEKGFHMQIVENSTLWFASARSFNDPFDCALHYEFEDDPQGIQLKWALSYARRFFPHLTPSAQRKAALATIAEMNSDPTRFKDFSAGNVERNYNKFGMCSLTPFRDSLLMWAHYGCHHTGFCVGLDTDVLFRLQSELVDQKILLDLITVSYDEKIPRINFYQSMLDADVRGDIITMISTKSDHWKYEQEYRLVCWDKVGTSLDVGQEAIAEIILGCKIEPGDKKRLLQICKNRGLGARIYQAEREEYNFELSFTRIA